MGQWLGLGFAWTDVYSNVQVFNEPKATAAFGKDAAKELDFKGAMGNVGREFGSSAADKFGHHLVGAVDTGGKHLQKATENGVKMSHNIKDGLVGLGGSLEHSAEHVRDAVVQGAESWENSSEKVGVGAMRIVSDNLDKCFIMMMAYPFIRHWLSQDDTRSALAIVFGTLVFLAAKKFLFSCIDICVRYFVISTVFVVRRNKALVTAVGTVILGIVIAVSYDVHPASASALRYLKKNLGKSIRVSPSYCFFASLFFVVVAVAMHSFGTPTGMKKLIVGARRLCVSAMSKSYVSMKPLASRMTLAVILTAFVIACVAIKNPEKLRVVFKSYMRSHYAHFLHSSSMPI